MADTRHPPLPPGAPRPPSSQPQGPMPPRPAGAPPPGVPPRPMPPGPMPMGGRPAMPPHGVKMPPRPMGVPPAGKRPMGAPPMMKTPQGDFVPMPGHMPPPSPYGQPPHPMPVEPEIEDDLADIMDEEAEAVTERDLEDEDDEFVGSVRFEPSPYDDNMAADMGLPAGFLKTKVLIPLFVLFLFLGTGLGMFIGNPRQVVSEELPGVVSNPEIPKGRPRCGLSQKGQGCVLYLMNAQRREVEAKEFFGMAADMLSIPKFQIETANIRYATTRVPPGYIALFNIPPVQ